MFEIVLIILLGYLAIGALVLAFLETNVCFKKLAQDVFDGVPETLFTCGEVALILRLISIGGWPYFLYVLIFVHHE